MVSSDRSLLGVRAYQVRFHDRPPRVPRSIAEEKRLGVCHVVRESKGGEDERGEHADDVQDGDAMEVVGFIVRRLCARGCVWVAVGC